MLDKLFFIRGMKKMLVIYNREMTENQIILFYPYFEDYTEEKFKYTIEESIKKYTFFPSVAQMINISNTENDAETLANLFILEIRFHDIDLTLKIFEKKGNEEGVEVIKRNYKQLRELQIADMNTMKAQLREQYKALIKYKINEDKKIKINGKSLKIEKKDYNMIGEK